MADEETKDMLIRLPKKLGDRFDDLCEKEKRNRSAQFALILEEYFKASK